MFWSQEDAMPGANIGRGGGVSQMSSIEISGNANNVTIKRVSGRAVDDNKKSLVS